MRSSRPLPLLALSLLLVALFAGPAWAHASGGDVSNYTSRIDGLIDPDAGTVPVRQGLVWRVVGGDALLSLQNRTGTEVVIAGYEGEPYLRIGPDGVFENTSSPAAYLNDDRYGRVSVPASATADARPRWVRVAEAGAWAWHDHRIHWMAATDPPQVKADATRPADVLRWEVPIEVGGQRQALTGTLTYVPPPPVAPWLAGGLLAVGLPLVAALPAALRDRGRARRGRKGPDALARAAAAGVGLAAVLAVVHGLDDLLTVPASGGEQALLLARTSLVVLAALLGAGRALRSGSSGALVLAAGGLVLVAGTLSGPLAALGSSQLATSLPPAVARLAAATGLAALLPVTVAAGVAVARERARRAMIAPSAAAPGPQDPLVDVRGGR